MWGQGRYRGHPVYGAKVSSPDRIYQILMPICVMKNRIEKIELEKNRKERKRIEKNRVK